MFRFAPAIATILLMIQCTGPPGFQTKELYEFENQLDQGTAALLFYNNQLIDTVSLNHLVTKASSAVYIEFHKNNQKPPFDTGGNVYGREGNYGIFYEGTDLRTKRLPRMSSFSSPVLSSEFVIYWGFVNDSVYAFRTNLETLNSDSVLVSPEVTGTDFRYAYGFPVRKDSLWLFHSGSDSVWIDFNRGGSSFR